MVHKSELLKEFSSLGVQVNDSLADDFVAFCEKYDLDEETIVETWVAFSLTKYNGAPPNQETITDFEREELSQRKSTPVGKLQEICTFDNQNLLDSLANPTSLFATPKRNRHSKNARPQFSPAAFTTDLYSSSPTYVTRKNTGQTVATFGKSCNNWNGEKCNLIISHYLDKNVGSWKYLYDTLRSILLIFEDACLSLANQIIEKNELPKPVLMNSNEMDEQIFIGRVCYVEKSTSNVSKVSVHDLAGPNGLTMDLELGQLSEFALFPGQVLAIRGKVAHNKIITSELYTSCPPSLPSPPSLSGTLQIVVATGPLTLSDTMSYEPLNDLVAFVKENQPNILFLIGPIIDASHPMISEDSISESFFEYYERIILQIGDSFKDSNTEVYIVASARDAVNIPVYPTPPVFTKTNESCIHFCADPSLLRVDGLIIGITATDTILHIGKQDCCNVKKNRLGLLAAHLINQQSFYPVHPSDNDVVLDPLLWQNHCHLPVIPHILITPSDLHCFIKEIEGCIVVNPGRLSKGMAGGTFACIEVQPPMNNDTWSTISSIAAKIVRV